MLRSRRVRILIVSAITGLVVVLFAPPLTYREVQIPDGEFVAVANASLYRSLVSVLPGQAGDKPGRINIVRRDGRSCGAAAVDMVSMVGELQWRLDRAPREAWVVATARWNLDACTVEVFGR